jgi:hypothetical protein
MATNAYIKSLNAITDAITDVATKKFTIRKWWFRDFGASLCSDAVSVFYEYWIRLLAFYSIGSLFAPPGDENLFSLLSIVDDHQSSCLIIYKRWSFTSIG